MRKRYIAVIIIIIIAGFIINKIAHQIDPDSIKVVPYMSSGSVTSPAGAGQTLSGDLGINIDMYGWAKTYKYRFGGAENREIEILIIIDDAFYSIRGEDKDARIKGER